MCYVYIYIYTFFQHNIPSDYNRLYCLYTAKLVFQHLATLGTTDPTDAAEMPNRPFSQSQSVSS